MYEYLRLEWKTISFIIITILWWAEFRIFPDPSGEKRRKSKSFRFILAAILISILSSIILTLANVGTIPINLLEGAKSFGLILYLSGIILRYWSSCLLGDYFTRAVEVEEDQKLVNKGPYRFIRHPLYLGLLLLTSAIPIFLGNFIALIITLILMSWSLRHRIKEEEDKLLHILGDKYQDWKEDKYKMIPFIY
ncbi:MAG: methyltransferase family protein [Bacillota bacterium]